MWAWQNLQIWLGFDANEFTANYDNCVLKFSCCVFSMRNILGGYKGLSLGSEFLPCGGFYCSDHEVLSGEWSILVPAEKGFSRDTLLSSMTRCAICANYFFASEHGSWGSLLNLRNPHSICHWNRQAEIHRITCHLFSFFKQDSHHLKFPTGPLLHLFLV